MNTSEAFDAVAQLADEFMERQRRGEHPTMEEYEQNYPDLADEIRDIFPALAVMERVAPAPSDLKQSQPSVGTTGTGRMTQIGDYRILREVGRGGMGVVYEAEQQSLRRRVALKVLPQSVSGDGKSLDRFQREARAAAGMHHTNIVPVFEVGEDQGQVFYAMQLIQGQGLDLVIEEVARLTDLHVNDTDASQDAARNTARNDRSIAASLITGQFESQQLIESQPRYESQSSSNNVGSKSQAATLAETAQLKNDSTISAVLPGQSKISTAASDRGSYFRSVAQIGQQAADALAYAHARGIIHRDIKPSNLLLDTAGVVWITDFGLAKTGDQGLTHTGDILGTIRYMSPERFRGQCDVRADVYSLGLTLYELLTLKPAFSSSDQLTLMDRVRETEPNAPRDADPRIPADLETIVLKAIDKDPKRRYQSADDLEDDLQRYLADEPIRARRISPVERFMRWSRRNKSLAAATLTIACLLSVGFVVAVIAAGYFRDLQQHAQLAKEAAQLAQRTADQQKVVAVQAKDDAEAAAKLAQERAATINRNLYLAQMNLAAQAAMLPSGLSRVRELIQDWIPNDGTLDRRGWEWYYLRSRLEQGLQTIEGHPDGVNSVSWSPDGEYFASAGNDDTVKIWDSKSRRLVASLVGHSEDVTAIDWSSDGSQLASASLDGTARIWDVATRRTMTVLHHADRVTAVAWNPDDRRVATGNMRTIQLWDVATGREEASFLAQEGRAIESLAWHPDGNWLASSVSFNGTIRIWDLKTKTSRRLEVHEDGVVSLAWSPDGSTLLSGGWRRKIILWDTDTWLPRRDFRGHQGPVTSLAWSPDGKRFASSSRDTSIRLWSLETGDHLYSFQGHVDTVSSVSWHPVNHSLLSGSSDQTLKIWDVSGVTPSDVIDAHDHGVISIAWSPDGSRFATGSRDRTLKIWDASSYSLLHTVPDDNSIRELSWSPDGMRLVYCSKDKVKVWDMETLRIVKTFQLEPRASCVTWSPDGNRIAASSNKQMPVADGTTTLIYIWDATSFQLERTLHIGGHTGTIQSIAWSPDCSRIASGSHHTVKIWDVRAGAVQATIVGHEGGVQALSWSPDGNQLASGSFDNTIKLWDTKSHMIVRTMRGHVLPVNSIDWSPDGQRLVSSTVGHTLKLWDVEAGQEVFSAKNANRPKWAPDGKRILTTVDSQVQILDARRGYAHK